MARKSRWQQFTDNFNSVYGAFKQVGQDYETADIMDDEKFTAEGGLGFGLKGSELEKARYKALGDIYTKYGNADKGLEMRKSLADLEQREFDNNLNQQLLDELIFQRGLGASAKLRADTDNVIASTADTRSTTARRDEMAPYQIQMVQGKLVGQGLDNDLKRVGLDVDLRTADDKVKQAAIKTQQGLANVENTQASTAKTNADTDRTRALTDGEVTKLEIANDKAQTELAIAKALRNTAIQMGRDEAAIKAAEARVAEATEAAKISSANYEAATAGSNATKAKVEAEVAEDTQESTTEATIAANEASASASALANLKTDVSFDQLSREEQILMEISNNEYDSPEAEQAAYLEAITNDTRIDPARKLQLVEGINAYGLAELKGKAAELAQGAQNAIQTGGLEGLISFYDDVDDGDTLRLVEDGNTVEIISTRGDQETVVFSGSGDNAREIVTQQLYNQVSQPGTGLEVAAAVIGMEKEQAQTRLMDSQRWAQLYEADQTKAREELLKAQTDKVRQEIEASKGGLSESEKIAKQGLAALMKSAEYIMIGEAEGGLEQQAILRAQYMQAMKMKDAPPEGLKKPHSWFFMTQKQKDEWLATNRENLTNPYGFGDLPGGE